LSDARLAGCSVLVTRPGKRGHELAQRLRELGAEVEHRPTIAFLPPTAPELSARAIEGLERYDWLVFTSVTGVRFFVMRLRGLSVTVPAAARVAAIGAGTARALREAGIEPTLVARDSRSEGLAAAFPDEALHDARVLLVQPEVARDVLPHALASAGARVDAVPFYRTVADAQGGQAVKELCSGRYDVTLFSSPSTLRFLLVAAGERGEETRHALAETTRVAIGAVTATALADEGVPAHAVALEPTEDSLVEAVMRACCS
jgi:uroporphyrinogen-III synthase